MIHRKWKSKLGGASKRERRKSMSKREPFLSGKKREDR
jgi:hypothetical protein